MKRHFTFLILFTGLGSATFAAWTNVPSLATNPPKSQFASHELYFSDSDYELPYYLDHFAQVANSVVETTFTNGGVVYPRGFLNIKVNRNPSDNTPNNARILEMQMALAYFYTVNRPWNVYRGNANVKVRLEAMLTRWVAMQNPTTGLFTEYSANDWSLAPTSFGAMAVAQALDLIQDSGLAIDATVFNNAKATLRKALVAIFTDSTMKGAGSSYSNQYNGAYHAALLYLENWPDAELDSAFVAAVQDAAATDVSPVGYLYEADGPDFGYSGVHERNTRMAWTRLRNRSDLLPTIVGEEEKWAAWLGANLLLQPNISTPTFLINAGINTRTSTAYQTPESRPLSEFATNSRAFSYTDTEFTNAVRAKTNSLASTPTYETLTTNNAYSYVPTFVLEGLEKTETWHPTSAQRTAAMNLLPYLASARFNRILNNTTGNKELTVATFRRPTYYGMFNSGRAKVNQQKFGLGMLWNPSYGTALQVVAGNFTNSISTSWGTSRTNLTRVYEQLADEKTLGAVFRLNGSTLGLTNGTNHVADGTVTATYNLVDGTSTNGSKVVSFEESRIKVDVTHTNAFTERLPLIAPTSATLTTATNQLTLAHTNGSRLILRLLSGGSFTVASSDTSNLPSGLQRRAVTVSATNTLSYELLVTSDAFQAGTLGAPTSESYTPANAGADVSETVTFNLPLVNLLGASTTTNFNATLQASNGVSPITTNRVYGAVAGGATSSQPFTFSVSGNFGDPLTLTLTLGDGTNNYGTVSYSTLIGGVSSALTTTNWQNFDGVSAPALPAGWTSSVPTGTAGGWATTTNSPNSAPNSVSAVPTGSISEQRLESPAFTIPSGSGEPEIRFQHRWDTENTYDGGVLEISVDGGSVYQDIVSAGGSFLSGGYSGTLNSGYQNPLGGRQAWYGSYNSAYTLTRISLPSSMLGKSVRLRFRLGCDSSVAGTIWRIDTLQFVYKAPNYIQPAEITSGAPSGAVPIGPAYTHTFTAVGQPAPAFTVTSGTLPAGLTLSPSGVLSGTVTNAFTSRTITVAVTNGVTPVRTNGSQSFTLVASVPISISTTSPLATGTTGSSYTQTLAATGGQGPYTWSLSSGSFPPGLALSGGSISGTPLAAGTYNFVIAVTDSASANTSKNFSIVVTNPTSLSVVTPSLPGALVGTQYSQTLAAVSGTAPYSWSLASGTLPPGLSLSSGGVLSGNPTTSGTYNFALRATDSATPSAGSTRSFSIAVPGNLEITTASLPDARTGTAYSQTLSASDGTGPRTWTVSSGALPPGLSLTATNGVISGTPSKVGSYEFTIQIEDSGGSAATKALSIRAVNTLIWDSDPITAGIQSSNGTWTTASGTTNWSLSGGNIAWVDGSDGVINGGTLTLGSPVRVSGLIFSNAVSTVTGSNGLTVDGASTITTAVDTTLAVPVVGTSFTKAGAGRLILSNAAYAGNVNISAGELRLNEPAGERIWNGTLSGSGPLMTLGSGRLILGGSNTFTGQTTLTASSVLRLAHGSALGATNGNTRLNGDSNNAPGIELIGGITVPEPFQLIMWTPGVINTNTNHAQIRNVGGMNELTGQVGLDAGGGRWDIASDSGHLKISGPVINIAQRTSSNADSWRTLHLRGDASGEFAGLMADATNGFSRLNLTVLSGTWTLAGSNKTYTGATIISNGTLRVNSTLSSEVRLAGGTLTGQGGTSSNLIVSNSGTFLRGWTDWSSPEPAFTAAQILGTNNASLMVLLDGSGMTNFSETTKTIPVIASSNGWTGLSSSNLSVQAINFPGNGSWSLSTNTLGLVASYRPDGLRVLSSTNLPGGTNATVYNTQLVAAGGVAPRVWSMSNSNALPQGLTLQEDGWLSGTPLSSGTFHFEAVLTDSTSHSITNAFSLTVATPPLIVATTSLQPTTAGQYHNESLQATGGSAPYTWRLVSGSLPAGLSLSEEGWITGEPNSPGQSVFTVGVSDESGSFAETILSLEVTAAPGTYEAWSGGVRWPDPGSSGLSEDPDADGLPNLTEYAMGSSPLQAEGTSLSSSLTNISGQNYLVLKFRRSATAHDTTLEVLASTNLSDWTSQAQGTGTNGFILMNQDTETSVSESDVDQTGSFREVTFQDGTPAETQPKRFLRLKISR